MRAAQVGRVVARGSLRSRRVPPSHHLTGSRAFATLEWPAVKSLPQQEKVVVFTKVRGDSPFPSRSPVSHPFPHPFPLHVTQSYCGFCRDLVERFDDANVPVKEVQLDKFGEARCGLGQRACTHLPPFPSPTTLPSHPPPAENGNAIRDKLREETKQEHVPFIFIGGAHHGSVETLAGLKQPGTIKAVLHKAGVVAKPGGFFRT
jgi:hypothetical protein